MRSNHRKLALAVMGAGLLLGGVALAEDVWIKSDNVQIRSGKGAVYPVVANGDKGTQLSVEAHEGHWLKVQAKDKDGNVIEGYVFDGAISPDKVSGGGNLLAGVSGDTGAAGANAAKGLGEDATQYSQTKNLDTRPMDDLIAFRKTVKPEVWEAFMAEGKVGTDAP